ncbi:uncharacterized protein LOC122008560 [Zingiber officinale]|uniref:uncharacterized protein LOC122008560 n=1 Tax=Zingiber officinale TaxID=94328 RepID=UPI001C4C3DC0|nr:uncharacterized protein LOC122008560 [Zingiber officinale]XP_042420256.1 uncharacterized protein LOC122008560 [Zingiber officinale]XP_042420257.1 uncharacterized protein LOC122008560 [Zingiber officinale]XP_042420258.1 uncharacterized protein LOC122008560 [Zingiber officinale]XP_042420259.1 uncharacterized protein LOC122008560 [Zingiber officinale]XP_042420260.1 uncharacterized protein LOC122008560 [Zingiber officinale]XP_042420261.1 uncharacterized protein LOC122008560 [Zingiber officinal
MAPRRKKWTEEEERSLLKKYAGMVADGSLSCLRSRERRFRLVAAHVNAAHHAVKPSAYPFLWTWKDAATKVHNMRHQYLLAKRKLLALDPPRSASVDVAEQRGVSHWPNFLLYRSVFGDAPLPDPAPGGAFDNDGELGLGLGFDSKPEGGDEGADQEVEEEDEGFDFNEVVPIAAEPPPPPAADMSSMKARNATRAEMRLREWEARMEERDEERERARKERAKAALEAEEEREQRRRQARHQWMEEEPEWEERMDGRRQEWKKRVEGMLSEHRAEIEGIQARILHEQQSLIGQLLGVLSQRPPSPVFGGLSDGGGSSTALGNHHQLAHSHPVPYLSQMIQGLHHVTGIVPGEQRAGGDGPDDHFMVDD